MLKKVEKLKVLVACEFSGRVRDCFLALGHEAISCDLLPTEVPGPHYQCDVRELFKPEYGWDLMIAHPDCQHLAISGARWFPEKIADGRQQAGIDFFMEMINAPVEKIAVENPVGIMSSVYRKPDQYVQPYWFGDKCTKKTGLWLKNLPLLEPTNMVEPEYIIGKKDGKKYSPIHYCSAIVDGEERWKIRSRTFPGLAACMALQWGGKVDEE